MRVEMNDVMAVERKKAMERDSPRDILRGRREDLTKVPDGWQRLDVLCEMFYEK